VIIGHQHPRRSSDWASDRMRSRSNLRTLREILLGLHGFSDTCCCYVHLNDGQTIERTSRTWQDREISSKSKKRQRIGRIGVLSDGACQHGSRNAVTKSSAVITESVGSIAEREMSSIQVTRELLHVSLALRKSYYLLGTEWRRLMHTVTRWPRDSQSITVRRQGSSRSNRVESSCPRSPRSGTHCLKRHKM
jgi:hypothetical protein